MSSDYSILIDSIREPVIAKSLDNIKNSISVNSTQTCESSVNNIQSINIGQINAPGCDVEISGLTQKIDTKVNAFCIQNDNFKELINTAFKTEILNLRNEGKPQVANQLQNITNDIDLNKVTKCMSDVYNAQNMNFAGINMSCPKGGKLTIKNISQTIASDVLFTCIQNQDPELVEKINNIRVPPNEKIVTVIEPHNSLSTEEIVGITMLFFVIILIFIIIVIVLIKK